MGFQMLRTDRTHEAERGALGIRPLASSVLLKRKELNGMNIKKSSVLVEEGASC